MKLCLYWHKDWKNYHWDLVSYGILIFWSALKWLKLIITSTYINIKKF